MARRAPLGVGSLFSAEDEAGELFSESYLQVTSFKIMNF